MGPLLLLKNAADDDEWAQCFYPEMMPIVKTLTGPECTTCAEGVLWVQGNPWNSLWVQGTLVKSKRQWFNERDKWGV